MKNLFILLLAVLLVQCSFPKESVPISAEEAYQKLMGRLDKTHPGKGIDVFNDKAQDRPMAYALILSSAAHQYQFQPSEETYQIIKTCGDWLLKNNDLNNNNVIGYGLADAWDAFGDKSVNPAHNEYTITTSLAIAGLIDWYEIETDINKKNEILEGIMQCVVPYLDDTYDSPLGIPAYSLHLNDRKKDVFNPAVHLAGQLQRCAQLTPNEDLKIQMHNKADQIISALFSEAHKDDKGFYCWYYGTKVTKPNDMVHACYVIEGIRTYVQNGGTIPCKWGEISGHLDAFYSNDKWYEYLDPKLKTDERNSRLWGLGMMMYSLCQDGQYDKIEKTLWPQIELYHIGEGTFKFKENDERSMIRQDVHLLLGLSYYLFHK